VGGQEHCRSVELAGDLMALIAVAFPDRRVQGQRVVRDSAGTARLADAGAAAESGTTISPDV
jgi:hypothetical protein